MTTTSIFSEKRSRNPLQFLWTKWSNSNNQATTPNEEKYPQSMKSPLFGIPLENTIQQNNKGLCIPYTVQLCFNEIIKRGLKTEGLFRLSGATSEVIQLQLEFEQLQKQQSLTGTTTTIADLSGYDIHTITSVVKKYLHFLPDSVIPLAYHDAFLNSNLPIFSKEKGIPLLMDLIALLPEQHRHLLYAIISLSSHIQHDAHINMMNPEALAVVLAPVCTGLEKTLQLFTSSPVAKKPMSKKNIKLYPSKNNHQHYYHQQQHQQHPLQRINPYDIQQLIKKNAQWTLFWKWMIENSDAILERIDIKIDFSSTATSTATSTLSSTTSSSLHHTHSLLSLHSYYNHHHHQHHSPSPPSPSTSHHHHVSNSSIVDISQLPFDTHHILGSSSTLLSSSDKFYTTTTTGSSSPDSTSISSRNLLNHRSSRAKLRSKPSNQSILASGISLCNKSSHGFLRRLTSVSSLR
ncbi:Rho GTPase activation protein [Cunninghamella echinulata]|nr:Rho GTPase activation protein [Cunninghamella echinulata]